MNDKQKIHPGQAGSLLKLLREDDKINGSYSYDVDKWYDILSNISEKQYKYILHLKFSGKRSKLHEVLTDLGFNK